MSGQDKKELQALHRKSPRTLIEAAISITLFFLLLATSIIAWEFGYWPLTILCWVVHGHIGHTNLLAFHEASHYTLHPRRFANEFQGIALGSLILTPLSAYRWVHNQHHRHLGRSSDSEFWPFTNPAMPRGWRILAAFAELFLGFFYTPILFLRGVLVAEQMPSSLRKRLLVEYGLAVLLWTTIVGTVAAFELGSWFLIGYLVPVFLAGNLQSVRKFTEHMGLLGSTTDTNTRSVIDKTLLGRFLSVTILHIDYHGPHHQYAKIPHYNLPAAAKLLGTAQRCQIENEHVYRHYPHAIWDMLKTLANPRVGPQWLEPKTTVQEIETHLQPQSQPALESAGV